MSKISSKPIPCGNIFLLPSGVTSQTCGIVLFDREKKEKKSPSLSEMIPVEKLEDYIKRGIIEIAPLAYMRGRTLDNAFVILDEGQNTTHNQMKMFLLDFLISNCIFCNSRC